MTPHSSNSKLSIVCVHITPGYKGMIILLDQESPVNDDDSGKLYGCEDCTKKGPNTKAAKSTDNWTTICEDCLKEFPQYGK